MAFTGNSGVDCRHDAFPSGQLCTVPAKSWSGCGLCGVRTHEPIAWCFSDHVEPPTVSDPCIIGQPRLSRKLVLSARKPYFVESWRGILSFTSQNAPQFHVIPLDYRLTEQARMNLVSLVAPFGCGR